MLEDEQSFTDEQKESLALLELAMNDLFNAVVSVNDNGLQISEAFEAIGIEIPRFFAPAVNQLAAKLPARPLLSSD